MAEQIKNPFDLLLDAVGTRAEGIPFMARMRKGGTIKMKIKRGKSTARERREIVRQVVRDMIAADNAEVKAVYDALRVRKLSEHAALDEIGCAFLAVLWEVWNDRMPAPESWDAAAISEWLKAESRFSEVMRRMAAGEAYLDIWPDG